MRRALIPVLIAIALSIGCGKADNAAETAEETHKIQWTAYSETFEFFAESDPLVAGKSCAILAHFTRLADFKPLLEGTITLALTVAGQTVKATQAKPVRPGIYELTIVPGSPGPGSITIDIAAGDGGRIFLPDVVVSSSEEDAEKALHEAPARAPGVVFTKEKSWKVDFATERPRQGGFVEVIKTTARIQSAQGDEVIVTAKADGVVRFGREQAIAGKSVAAGQGLFSIENGGIAENNLGVRLAEARNNFDRARADYERAEELARDRIVSEKERLKAKNDFDNAKAVIDNLERNFRAGAQIVSSPLSGFIKNVFVDNGQFVGAGRPIVTISRNRTLLLRADVRQKFAPLLASVVSANIRTLHDNRTFTLEQLNGRILGYGQSADPDSYLIPVHLQIDNAAGFLPGGFVELILKTQTRSEALSVPNSAILEDQGLHYLFVQLNPEEFERREVRLGAGDGLFTEVLAGLGRDERVVSKGAIWVKLAQSSGALDAHAGHVH